MTTFLNLPIRRKFAYVFGFLVLVKVGLIVSGSSLLLSVNQRQQQLYANDVRIILDLMAIDGRFQQNRAAILTSLVLHGKDFDALSRSIEEKVASNRQLLAELSGLLKGREVEREFQEYRTRYEHFAEVRRDQVLPAVKAGDAKRALELMARLQDPEYNRISGIGAKLMEWARAMATAKLSGSDSAARAAIATFAAVGLGAVLLSVWLSSYLSRIIIGPLAKIGAYSDQVAAGNLSIEIQEDAREDELGALSRSFVRMVAGLRELNRELLQGVNVLASSSTEILAAAAQMSTGASETAAAVKETAVTVNEVKQSAHLATEKAQHVSEISQKAVDASERGRAAVDESVEGMRQIMRQMEAITDNIVRLSEQTQAVGDIVASVSDLTEQSKLLAVNASIEAAKAGEHGRGFAVVAQEVRHLAAQSKQATGEIKGILAQIQKATSSSVMATEQGSKAVEAGMRQSARAGDAIRVLAETVDEAASAAMQIAASSREQLVGMDQISIAMENIRVATDQHVTGTKQTEEGSRRITELGKRLKELSDRFNV